MDFNLGHYIEAHSGLKSKIRVAFEKGKREMSDNFCGVEIRFQQSYYQNMAQLKKDDEKICIICYEDLELDDSFEAPNSVEIFNIPSSVGKHQVVDAMRERNLPMPSEFNYYELIGKFEGPMRAYVKYATAIEAQYVVETLKSNALEARGSILEFKPMAKKNLRYPPANSDSMRAHLRWSLLEYLDRGQAKAGGATHVSLLPQSSYPEVESFC
jgi:hypothetical protein